MFRSAKGVALGKHDNFLSKWQRPIEEEGDTFRREQLVDRVGAVMLRRTRDGVLNDFPSGDVDFQVGDQVVVQTEPAELRKLHKLNNDSPPY